MGRKRLFGKDSDTSGFFEIAIIIIIVLLLFGIISVVIGNAFTNVNDFIQDDDDLTNSSKAVVSGLEDRYPATLDGAFVVILGLFYILCLAISWVAIDNPFLMVVAIVIMLFLLAATAMLSNVWEEFTTDTDLGATVASYPMTGWALDHFLVVALVFISSMVVVMFSKNRLG